MGQQLGAEGAFSAVSVLDKPQTLLIALGRRYRDVRRILRSTLTAMTGVSGFIPTHISMAPRDLKTADPLAAKEFYRGRYFLGGILVETSGQSPFNIPNAQPSWLEALHNFSWLRHFSAQPDKLTSDHLRVMIQDWLVIREPIHREAAWKSDTTSRRLISFLCHSDVILANSDHEFHTLFMRNLAAHVRFLIRNAPTTREGMPRILAYLALSYASICHDNQDASLKFAREKLAFELSSQILPDGGHISRNPNQIVEILALLLPFRQSCLAAGIEVPKPIHAAIERMLPALRFYRMGDGNVARFNGAGLVQPDLIATILRHDETLGESVEHATHSGYQRMVQDESLVLMDVGDPPKGEHSTNAHAGCLSFEFSSGTECIVVNCGSPPHPESEPISVWRTTAAHSTAVFCDTSSCRFENSGSSNRQLSGQILTRDLDAKSEREETDYVAKLYASHAGYLREFGAVCHRTLYFETQGGVLSGCDEFTAQNKAQLKYSTRDQVEIHFHLHPDVKPDTQTEDQETIIFLETRQKQLWKFSCKEATPELEESIFFASHSGSRQKTHRIVLKFGAYNTPEVNWSFENITP